MKRYASKKSSSRRLVDRRCRPERRASSRAPRNGPDKVIELSILLVPTTPPSIVEM